MSSFLKQEINELHMKIGKNVKTKREDKGYSQLKLSQEIGQKSTTMISQAELGKKKHFNIEQLHKIAKVLKCDICDFFN